MAKCVAGIRVMPIAPVSQSPNERRNGAANATGDTDCDPHLRELLATLESEELVWGDGRSTETTSNPSTTWDTPVGDKCESNLLLPVVESYLISVDDQVFHRVWKTSCLQCSSSSSRGTVLVPVLPTVLPNGEIEMRLVTSSLPRSQLAENRLEDDPDRDDESGTTWSCSSCPYTTSRRFQLVRHSRTHSDSRLHRCEVCDARFKCALALVAHRNVHVGAKPHVCPVCARGFATPSELARHNRYKHTNERPHKCPQCEFSSVELSKLKRHIRSHTGEKTHSCDLCPYMAIDQYKMKRHMRSHTGEKPYECEVCSARFSQSNSLNVHKRGVHDKPRFDPHSAVEDKVVFACPLCPTTCSRRSDLRIHNERMHNAAGQLQCTKCAATFADRFSLREHAKSHRGQKCFACPRCPYQTNVMRLLDQHMLIHNETKTFVCTEPNCDARFRQAAQLRRHYNHKHDPFFERRSGDKTHMCHQVGCARRFRHLGNLERHLKSHADENASARIHSTGDDRPREIRKERSKRVKLHEVGITNVKRRGRPRKARGDLDQRAPLVIEEEQEGREGLVARLQMSFESDEVGSRHDYVNFQGDETTTNRDHVAEKRVELQQGDQLLQYPVDDRGFPRPAD